MRASVISDVRRHCQTIALCTGMPESRSHTTVVSRWLVMPMAAIRSEWMPLLNWTSIMTAICEARISMGSCSTQPGRGYMVLMRRDACATMQSYSSTMTALTDVVPESSAMMYRPPIETYVESTLLRSLSVTAIEGTFLKQAPCPDGGGAISYPRIVSCAVGRQYDAHMPTRQTGYLVG